MEKRAEVGLAEVGVAETALLSPLGEGTLRWRLGGSGAARSRGAHP